MAMEAVTVALAGGPSLSLATSGQISGPADSWRSYKSVLELLPSWIRAVAVSQRGHGDSDKPTTGYLVEDFAGDVVRLLDSLRVKRAVLVGHSGCCFVARRVALDRPDRVAGLVLEASPTTLKGDARLEAFVSSIVAGLEDPIDPAFVRSFVVETSSDLVEANVVDQQVDELLKMPARVWKEMFSALLSYEDLDHLHRLVAPTLLIWGDGDMLVGRDMQDQLIARLPHGELHEYSGVGHAPRWDNPARFASDLAGFVKRLHAPESHSWPPP